MSHSLYPFLIFQKALSLLMSVLTKSKAGTKEGRKGGLVLYTFFVQFLNTTPHVNRCVCFPVYDWIFLRIARFSLVDYDYTQRVPVRQSFVVQKVYKNVSCWTVQTTCVLSPLHRAFFGHEDRKPLLN